MLSVFYLFALSLLKLSWHFGFIGMVCASCSMVKLTVLLFGNSVSKQFVLRRAIFARALVLHSEKKRDHLLSKALAQLFEGRLALT